MSNKIEETVSAVNTTSVGPDVFKPVKLKGTKYSVFDVSDEVFSRFVNPKRKYKKWSDYIEEENEHYGDIRKCVKRGDMVVLRNSRGSACVLRNYKQNNKTK